MKVIIVRLENIELRKSVSKCIQITPSLSTCMLFCPHTLLNQIHLLSFLETGYRFHSLCLPSTWLFSHLLLLSSPLFPIQIRPSSSISVQRSPMREHSHCLFHLQACLSLLEITWMALKLLQNKGSYKSTDCSNINDSNRAHTSKAAREFILVMRWRDALHISQLGLWFMPLNEVML